MIARRGELHDPKLKPKIQDDYCTWNCWIFSVLNLVTASSSSNGWGRDRRSALFAQVQFADQFFVTIGFRLTQIIEQASALRDHFKQAASRRMIFPVGLKVLGQVLDPVSEKCDLHIRAAGIFLMQLELLEIRRLVALCHNEGANVDEDRILATHVHHAGLPSRLPSYHKCNLARDRAMRGPPRIIINSVPRICLAGYMRNFRPEVRTGSLSTLKRPSFLSARLK